jgi:hypothetical protein
LLFSAIIGPSAPSDIGLDAAGNAYVAGLKTTQEQIPTTPNAFRAQAEGYGHYFVTRLNAGGATLGYSTYGANAFD